MSQSWVQDACGRFVPAQSVLPGAPVYTSANGFALPQGIFNVVRRNHPYGKVLRAERAGCTWNIWVCDQGRHFLMNIDDNGRIFRDALR